MMRTGLTVLVTLVLLAPAVCAQGPNKGKLRELARLPAVTIKAGIVEHLDQFFLRERPHHDVPAEITKLEKEMRGDACDAERYEKLGDLYTEANDTARAEAAYDKAVVLYRKQAADRPQDGRVLFHLANNLPNDRLDEGEALLRRAVALAPGDWECWQALEGFLKERAIAVLGVQKLAKGEKFAFGQLVARAAQGKIARADAQRADGLFREACHCADEAVLAAPKDARVYMYRGGFRFVFRQVELAIALAMGDADAARAALLTPAVLDDLHTALKLDPTNDRAFRLVFVLEAFNELQGPAMRAGGGLEKSLSPRLQQMLHDVVVRYEAAARGPNPATAAEAAEELGLVRLLFQGDVSKAEADLRQAMRLDPTRDGPWDLLMLLLCEGKRWQDLLVLNTERVKHADTPRNRFLLAKAYAEVRQFDKVEEALTQILQKAPDYAEAVLGQVVPLLRRGDEASLARARAQLERAEPLVTRAATPELQANYGTLKAIYLGLTGQAAEAQRFILDVLIQDGTNDNARAVLEALGQEQGTVLSPPPALPVK
jgi:tetratricopeptide (TPR) repeat protein